MSTNITTTTPTTTKTLTGNFTTITIGNYTTITREKATSTSSPTYTQENPTTMSGYPKTVRINELILGIDKDEYYFKSYYGHELTITYISDGVSQTDIVTPVLSIGINATITINLNGIHVTLYMLNINTLVVTKVVT
jgi:hypothetical protein